MKKQYIKVATIPKGEEIVDAITYGGGYYWNYKFPFRHYKEPKYLVATKKAIYQLDTIKNDK